MKYNHDDFVPMTVKAKASLGRPLSLANVVHPSTHNRALPISKAKFKDLREFCDDSIIAPVAKTFYATLTAEGVEDDYYQPNLSPLNP